MNNTERRIMTPSHSHYFNIPASTAWGHSHTLQGFVFSVSGTAADGHVHSFKAISSAAEGHVHQVVNGVTGPAIPLPNGSHFHKMAGVTGKIPYIHKGNLEVPASYPIHDHAYVGATGAPIGFGTNF